MPEAPSAETGQPTDTPAAPPAAAPAAAPEAPAIEPAELATLREQAQTLTDQAQAAQRRAEAAELDLARLTVIRTARLPDTLADRLRGGTADELTADATALAEIITGLITAATTAVPPARTTAGRPPVEALRPAASARPEPVQDTPEQISRLVWGK